MINSDRDFILGAAIQLIKDISKLAFLGDESTCMTIKHMTEDFLKRLEVKSDS